MKIDELAKMEEDMQVPLEKKSTRKRFVLGEDYYINEEGNWVFTAEYHLRRGHCCNNGCKHCPYPKPH